MSKSKLLTFGVIALFIINIITLSFFILKSPKHSRNKNPKMPREIIIERLHFDQQQVKQYEDLIKNHRDSIAKFDEKIKKSKNKLYDELSKANNQNVVDSLFVQLATAQTTIEKLHYNHFLAIKKLCKPEQVKDYDILTSELAKIFDNKAPTPRERKREH